MIAHNMGVLATLSARVGYVGPLGTARHGDVNMATLAAFLEFGTDDIPARPFLRSFYTVYKSEIAKLWEVETASIINAGVDPVVAVTRVAKGMAKLALERFDTAQAWAIPDAPETRKAKGSNIPLVDTGRLRSFLGWAVLKQDKIIDYGKA